MESRFFSRHSSDVSICELCPRQCKLKEGQRGFCFVRKNIDGAVILTAYGRSSGFAVDPIEKKPLNHFLPGSRVFSFGTAGCNLGCKFCQNWDMSKSRSDHTLSREASPEDIAFTAEQAGCESVAFTYNDPVIFAEYAVDTARACHNLGIKTVAVTAGYISARARPYFFKPMDAVNVDLKSIQPDFYRRMAAGKLEPVLETLLYLKHETSIWMEMTHLIIPGHNDSQADLEKLCQWVVEHLGTDVPLHFTAFHPAYKLSTIPRTPNQTLLRAREIAKQAGIDYIYLGNCRIHGASHTFCHYCGLILIQREGYRIQRNRITIDGRCPDCKTVIPGIYN